MYLWLSVIGVVGASFLENIAGASNKPGADAPTKSIYDMTVKDIDGKDVALSKYKGDVLLIVNTASK